MVGILNGSGVFSSGIFSSGASTSRMAERSVEKGVFSSSKGFGLRCLEIRPRRAVEGREGARVGVREESVREKTVDDKSRSGAARIADCRCSV